MPSFVAGVAEKYGDKSFVSIMDEIGRMKAKVAPGDSVTFNSYDKHKYIEDGK